MLEESRGTFYTLFTRIEKKQFVALIEKIREDTNPNDSNSCNYIDHIIEALEEIIGHKREKVRKKLENFSA